jgi:methylated-DNA-[protein]-cysteine S-methyltransferase
MDLILFETPFGRMGLASEDCEAISRLYFPNEPTPAIAEHETPLLALGKHQLLEYFAGVRTAFDLPLSPKGTPFQGKVWNALSAIPYGETRSYGDIAASIGNPRATRAVGGANHRNPIPILIPCHRVVGADGSLTGFGGGLELKESLLNLEQRKEHYEKVT